MKISMVMIAKDEEANVATCFDSFWGDVDEVVLVDTGSTDNTIRAAKTYAYDRGEADKLIVGEFAWIDDFAAARTYADSLATGEWRSWCDLDDVVHGLGNLRELAETAAPQVQAFFCSYSYAQNDLGDTICELRRERLVRAGACQWTGRIHEFQKITGGQIVNVDESVAQWVHTNGPSTEESFSRNTKLLKAWLVDEPDNPRPLAYMGLELAGNKDLALALPFFKRYFEVSKGREPLEARAQTCRYYATALLALGEVEEAKAVTVQAIVEMPSWPDSYLTLSEIAHAQHDWPKAAEFAAEVVRRGRPDTALIVNPLDYTVRPRVLIAVALQNMGQLPEAIQTAQQAQEIVPGYMGVDAMIAEWGARKQREEIALTWENCARLLTEYDEIEKAAVLIHTAPFAISDHPRLISAKVYVDQLLDQPYQVRLLTEEQGAPLIKGLAEQAHDLDGGLTELRVFDPSGASHELIAKHMPEVSIVTSVEDGDVLPHAAICAADLDNQCEPEARLAQLALEVQENGRVYVITPDGRLGNEHTPGRRRSLRGVDVAAMMRRYGTLTSFEVVERTVVASFSPCEKREEIAVWTGQAIGPWHPNDITEKGLGGSETAAWRIAQQLSLIGYCVTLYGQFEEQGCVKDVVLRHWSTFDPLLKRKAVIALRDSSMFEMANINADKKILWLEDTAGAEGLTEHRAGNLDVIATVSEWHRDNMIDTYPWLDTRKIHAHRNGITRSFFDGDAPEREQRVVYTSSPDRGLDIVLECWPEIVRRVPGATLAHCYGPWYDMVAEVSPAIAEHRRGFKDKSDYEGVESVGHLGQQKLATLMRSSLVWVAPSYFSVGKCKFSETSCISAMEAQAAGLRIVASRWGALQETVKTGVLLDGNPADPAGEWRQHFIDAVVAGLTDAAVQAKAQLEGPIAVQDMGWRGVAEGLMREWGADPRALSLQLG